MAELKVKRPPVVSVEGMDRIVQQIYDDINDIIRAINSHLTSLDTGKVGDFKVITTDVNTYELRVKTNDGWLKTELSFVDKEN
tara:strand:- start:231 stop:479 length:249 start_codon:yes stop_codon:yes gene_type:complete